MTLLTRLHVISPVFSSSDCISSPASRSVISGSSYSYEPSERRLRRRNLVSAVTQCPDTLSAVGLAYGKVLAPVAVEVMTPRLETENKLAPVELAMSRSG